MKRTLAGVAATTLAVGGMLVATAAPASAHTPRVSDSCTSLEVKLTQYQGADVVVTIDGAIAADESFGDSWRRTFELDGSKAHEWSVQVDAHDGDRYDWPRTPEEEKDAKGTTTPCVPTTPEQPEGTDVQVGIYLYPKLDKDKPAAWENSGKQQLLGTTPLTVPEDELTNDQHWYTELPETDALDDIDLCTGWGIQQDLVRGGVDDYTMPETITYPDGSSMDGHLVDWQHQELSDFGIELPSTEDCATPTVPEVPEPQVVVPQAPAALEICGADASDVILPADTGDVTYLTTEQGVLAVPTEGRTFGDDLAGYTRTEGGDVIFPIEQLVPSEEDCALVPGDIGAVCVGDTPYLDYGVSLPEGVEVDNDTPLTITFLHPEGGENYVAADQPLEGELLWPGASDTAPKQWPGWEQQDDGSYVETDGNYAWTRDDVEVLFEVNPEYSQIVSYPEANTECANPIGAGGADVEVVADDTDVPPAEAEGADELPQTGATVGVFAGIAALLIVGGGVLFWLRRRIQH
ncbi:LPXTG cell wall anchor domain-containing protein [Isoptericola sp. NPDC056578]|uniref:LPXTG cell wall anchor domain-containing protein n=1 Tax=Isoptericola sp. NPDC056578 TaxID=3345870 RepID=UPI00367BD9C7